MGAHNSGSQIKGLYKLASVTKGKLFISYKNWYAERHDFILGLRFNLTFSQQTNIYE